MPRRQEQSESAPAARPVGPPPDRDSLREAALRHLSRFAATEAGLLRVLHRRIARWQAAAGADEDATAAARDAARAVVAALAEAGAVDDAAYAEARSRRLVRTGRSRRAVAAHLAAKGVDPAVREAALPDAEAERLAAVALARRRRLGPFGPPLDDPALRQKALGTLARAGFARDVAEAVLRMAPDEAEALLAKLRAG